MTLLRALGGFLLLVAAAVGITIARDDGGPSAGATAKPARLEAAGLVVRNGLSPTPKPSLEILLHNTGDRRVVVNRARIEIRRARLLPLCFTQGSLPLSESYGARLPTDPAPGEIVEVPLHQQLGPDEADRFRIALSVDAGAEGGELEGLYLYELGLSLAHDSGRAPLRMGAVLASLPEAPAGLGHYYWDDRTAAFLRRSFPNESSELWASLMPCWRSNTEALRGALSRPGARSPELAEIEETLATPTLAALE